MSDSRDETEKMTLKHLVKSESKEMTDGGRKGLGVSGNKLQYKELEEFCIKLVELSGGMGEMKFSSQTYFEFQK